LKKVLYYLKRFKIAFIVLALVVAVFVGAICFIVPQVKSIVETSESIKTKVSETEDLQRKLDNIKREGAAKRRALASSTSSKAVYRPIGGGGNAESIMSEEIGEILQMMKDNGIKTRSMKYEYDPQDDNFIKNLPNKYNAARLNLDIIAEYRDFERFLRDVYKHEHYIDIAKVEVTPYSKNKKVLLINAQIKLYAEK
jgi:Tfp pilus assembly protein PilO